MEILAKLGIDWRLLIAQGVNFAILLFVLYRFAYKPMLAFLEKRSSQIEKGLKDAEEAAKKLSAVEEKEREVLDAARKDAKELLAKMESSAKKRDAERLQETEEKAARILADAETKIQEEREKVLAEAKGEIASLVALSVEKILKEKMDPEKDKELVEKI